MGKFGILLWCHLGHFGQQPIDDVQIIAQVPFPTHNVHVCQVDFDFATGRKGIGQFFEFSLIFQIPIPSPCKHTSLVHATVGALAFEGIDIS